MSPFCPPMQAGGRWDEVTQGGGAQGVHGLQTLTEMGQVPAVKH